MLKQNFTKLFRVLIILTCFQTVQAATMRIINSSKGGLVGHFTVSDVAVNGMDINIAAGGSQDFEIGNSVTYTLYANANAIDHNQIQITSGNDYTILVYTDNNSLKTNRVPGLRNKSYFSS